MVYPMEKTIAPLLASLLISALGAGSGVAAWFQFFYQEEVSIAAPFSQDDFDSPVFLAFTLRRNATLTVAAAASHLVHNPKYGQPGWTLGAGVLLEIYVDNEPCGDPKIERVDGPILDGRRLLQIDASCGPKDLGPGQHFLRIQAAAIGNCLSLSHIPETCTTRRVRGAYTLIE